jgi:hypothetical protein
MRIASAAYLHEAAIYISAMPVKRNAAMQVA